MKIVATSDLHGHLPLIPKCDTLLICGDICPFTDSDPNYQLHFMRTNFAPWLESAPADNILWIAGNHDFVCQRPGFHRMAKEWRGTYLQDEKVEIDGIAFYGTPWTRSFGAWAFMTSEQELAEKYKSISGEVIITHGPPQGYCDFTASKHQAGSWALLDKLKEVKPKLTICGHIHEAYGREQAHEWDGEIINCSLVDLSYSPVNKVVEIEI